MKAVVFCNSEQYIQDIYGSERLEKIGRKVQLEAGVFSSNDLGKIDFSDVDFIFSTWGLSALTQEEWAQYFPNLKALFYAAGATDNFARPLFARGVKIFSAWRANAVPVAEFTVAEIVLALKNFFKLVRTGHQKDDWFTRYRGRGCFGATVSLLGSSGAISTRVQEMLEAYTLKVIVIPSRPQNRTVSLEEAFRISQVVSNHLPDRDDNIGCITGSMLESMPYGGVFINTGRGRQVNEKEMIEVLKRRPDLTALLDVQFPEPPEEDSELYTLPNVFMTPHIAGSLGDELHRMADYVIGDFENFLDGRPTQYEVSESMLLTSK